MNTIDNNTSNNARNEHQPRYIASNGLNATRRMHLQHSSPHVSLQRASARNNARIASNNMQQSPTVSESEPYEQYDDIDNTVSINAGNAYATMQVPEPISAYTEPGLVSNYSQYSTNNNYMNNADMLTFSNQYYASGNPSDLSLPSLNTATTTTKPRKHHPIFVFIAFIAIIIIIVNISVYGAGELLNGSLSYYRSTMNDLDNGGSSSLQVPGITTVYRNSDIKEWQDKNAYINDAYTKYNNAVNNGTILQLTTSRDSNYISAFLTIISDYKAALPLEADTTSTHKDELVKEATDSLNEFKAKEAAFANGSDLGTKVKIKNDDGTWIEFNGTSSVNTPKVTDDIESKVAAFTPYTDENGTYLQAAADIAAIMGLRLNYDFDSVKNYCDVSNTNLTEAMAVYCSKTPNQIYVNTNHQSYSYEVKSTRFISDIRHEMAHHAIDSKCGSTQPSIVTDKNKIEAVTSSYAVMFLGASRDDLSNANDLDAYRMTSDTDNEANLIHANSCVANPTPTAN